MIPRNSRIGFLLRRIAWFFRLPNLPKCDSSMRIHPMAIFEGYTENIELGEGVIIDAYARIFCHKSGKVRIGAGTYIGDHAIIHTGKKDGSVVIGSNCSLQSFSIVHGHGGCEIGNDVRIAAHSIIIPANHRFADTTRPIREQGLTKLGIKIENDVWIGTNTVVLDGVTVGTGSVIGTGSVVNKTIPPGSVAVGSPARVVANRNAVRPDVSDLSDPATQSNE
ncbi:acyltransferase [Herbaspirillum sp. NPDC101396]|uniref:acyltransferase n=1 Tax=Herbaspirillum sp. NPDC101396 TaxID=3364005 RepID=UPI00383BF56A